MRYAVNRASRAVIPETFIGIYLKAEEQKTTGIPEINHPKDFWEVLDLRLGKIWTNYPNFKWRRKLILIGLDEIDVYGYTDYDFDHLPLPIPVISHLTQCNNWFWRYSTTFKGLHILCKHDSLRAFDDPIRETATSLRGYSWYWSVKNGFKSQGWNKGKLSDAIRFLGINNRQFLRREPPKHKKKRRYVLK